MADGKRTKNIWNDDDGEIVAPKKRRRVWGVVSFFLILLVVLAVVVLAAYRDGTGFDVLRRYLSYGGAEEVGGESVYDYDADATNHFAVLDQHLVVLSETNLKILSPDGEVLWSKGVSMTAPMLDVGDAYAVAYDVGGGYLRRGLFSGLSGNADRRHAE